MIITCPWLTCKAVPRRCWAYVGYRRVDVYKVAVVAIRSHDLKVWKRGFDRETHLLIGKFIPTCPATPSSIRPVFQGSPSPGRRQRVTGCRSSAALAPHVALRKLVQRGSRGGEPLPRSLSLSLYLARIRCIARKAWRVGGGFFRRGMVGRWEHSARWVPYDDLTIGGGGVVGGRRVSVS